MNGGDLSRFLYERDPIVDPRSMTGAQYRQHRRTGFQKYFLGSAWWAAAGTFAIMLIIDIVQLVVIDLVIEHEFPTIFPVDSFLISFLTGVLMFAGPLFIGIEQSFQHTMLFDVLDIKGNTVTLASEIVSFVNIKRIREMVPNSWSYSSRTTLDRGERPLYQIIRELNEILRILPWARTVDILALPGQKEPVDETSYPSNLTESVVQSLPISQNLKYELESYRRAGAYAISSSESAVADQLYNMIYARMASLQWSTRDGNSNLMGTSLFVGSDRQMSGLSTVSARLQANLLASITPIIKSFLFVCTIVWGLLIPIVAWGSFRWFTIAVLFVSLYPALAIYYTGAKLEDQFRDYNDSYYVINDLKVIALEAQHEVDRVFDHGYRMAGVETPTDWRAYSDLESYI